MSPDLTSDEREKVFGALNKNLNRLERLIVDSATMAHLQRGIFTIEKKKIRLKELMKDIFEEYNTLLRVQIEFDVATCPDIEINVDPERIRQVIDNILDNTIKNTNPESREIEINCQNMKDVLEIIIHDNGAGIRQENLERIFDQFVTISNKYSTKGTGIGLYISKEILLAHWGNLSAQSEGESKGVSFSITIPKEN